MRGVKKGDGRDGFAESRGCGGAQRAVRALFGQSVGEYN